MALPTQPQDDVRAFSDILRERTQAIHREAERAGFVADLLRGRATREGYALYLRNLLPAYEAMEPRLAAMAEGASVFADPRLARAPAIRSDLHALAGTDWAVRLSRLPEAAAYGAAIEAACPAGLLGHAYARYLGDLSGGQILEPLLARRLELGPEALSLYAFRFDDLAVPKAAMRAALDRFAPGSAEAEALVAAALDAFRHNIAVSEAVQAATA